jgi:hypothetical protein
MSEWLRRRVEWRRHRPYLRLARPDGGDQALHLLITHIPPERPRREVRKVLAACLTRVIRVRGLVLQQPFPQILLRENFGDDLLRCCQIFFEQNRRERENIADVVKTVPNIIRREVIRGLEFDAREIADRVVVFNPVQPPDRDSAGVAFAGAIEVSSSAVIAFETARNSESEG